MKGVEGEGREGEMRGWGPGREGGERKGRKEYNGITLIHSVHSTS